LVIVSTTRQSRHAAAVTRFIARALAGEELAQEEELVLRPDGGAVFCGKVVR